LKEAQQKRSCPITSFALGSINLPISLAMHQKPFRAIEFFSGIGGWSLAAKNLGSVAAAYDISQIANSVYQHNVGKMPHVRELASVCASEIAGHDADTWLMSPPCQPFCRMGNGHGLDDPRSAAFLRLMDLLLEARPRYFVLENVEGFLESDAFALLLQHFAVLSLKWRALKLCPTQFGIPNRRPRVFVLASAYGINAQEPPCIEPGPIRDYLDSPEDASLCLSSEIIARHGPGLDIVTPESCRSACFIGGYGKRFVGSGSFLKTANGIRRFSPKEISRLMGYPPDFAFPDGLSPINQYKLLGNGLNIVVVKWVLEQME
jgi:DNA (cytosine-5)-methyltransferase 1/tRNA (cytosine38-C5)-methyltransferase